MEIASLKVYLGGNQPVGLISSTIITGADALHSITR